MKTVLIIFFGSLAFSSFAQKAPIKTAKGHHQVEIKTSAICEMCKDAIEKNLVFERGVKEANLDLDTKIVTVVYNNKKTNPLAIRKSIVKTGYHADSLKRDPTAYENLPFCCKGGWHHDDRSMP